MNAVDTDASVVPALIKTSYIYSPMLGLEGIAVFHEGLAAHALRDPGTAAHADVGLNTLEVLGTYTAPGILTVLTLGVLVAAMVHRFSRYR